MKQPTIQVCAKCGRPLPPAKTKPRTFCSTACRMAAYRRRQAIAAAEADPVSADLSGWEDRPAPIPTAAAPIEPSRADEMVARAVLEATVLAATFSRLGIDARPQFSWRCTKVGDAIRGAIDEFFGEVV